MPELRRFSDPVLVLDAFDRNARVNAATIDDLSDELLGYSDDPGGYLIGQHLADMLDLREGKLAQVAPEHASPLESATHADRPTWLRATTVAEVARDFARWDGALRGAVVSFVDEQRRFEPIYRSHPATLLLHCIVHDAHHRGQIAALVRRSGQSQERRSALEDRTWSIWRS